MMDSRERLILQNKSFLIVQFISNFAKLEKKVKKLFGQEIINLDHSHRSKLYFMYGCTVGNEIYYDIDNECISLALKRKYNDTELFKSLNLNKIVKFNKKENIISQFNFTIDSVQKNNLAFPFHDSVIKLISMRNKLAHELDSISFREADIIEKLSLETLNKSHYSCLVEWNLEKFDDECLAIGSNIVYISIISSKLDVFISH